MASEMACRVRRGSSAFQMPHSLTPQAKGGHAKTVLVLVGHRGVDGVDEVEECLIDGVETLGRGIGGSGHGFLEDSQSDGEYSYSEIVLGSFREASFHRYFRKASFTISNSTTHQKTPRKAPLQSLQAPALHWPPLHLIHPRCRHPIPPCHHYLSYPHSQYCFHRRF